MCRVGPAGTGKSSVLIALGHAAVAAAMPVRYFPAADLVERLYRGMDDKLGGQDHRLLVVPPLICDERGFAPSTLPAASCCSVRGASHWSF